MSSQLDINVQKLDTTVILGIDGRIDTTTSPQLEEAISNNIEGIKDMVLDFAKVAYISSSGLRVLLSTQKKMKNIGTLTIRNVNEEVNAVFEVTGFSDILTIE